MFDIYLLVASACYRNTYQGDDVAAEVMHYGIMGKHVVK